MKVAALPLLLVPIFFLSCSFNQAARELPQTVDAEQLALWSPDIVIEDFTFSEVSVDRVEVEFSATSANYFEGVDIVAFEDVTGSFKGGDETYDFSLPSALYDRSKKFLVTTDRVTIEGERGFTVTGEGGVFDFGDREVTIERNVVYLSSSLRVEGERGAVDMKGGVLKLNRVNARVESMEQLDSEMKEGSR